MLDSEREVERGFYSVVSKYYVHLGPVHLPCRYNRVTESCSSAIDAPRRPSGLSVTILAAADDKYYTQLVLLVLRRARRVLSTYVVVSTQHFKPLHLHDIMY